jgi:hypothetical protein
MPIPMCPDFLWAPPRLLALRRCHYRTATNRPFVTESRQVVGGTLLLSLYRQK